MGGVRKTLSTLLAAAEPSLASLCWNGASGGRVTSGAGTRTVVVVSISGGPVTSVERRLLPQLIAGVIADLSTRDLDIGGVEIKWLHFEAVEHLLLAMQGFGGVDPVKMWSRWKFGEPGQWSPGSVQNAAHDILADVPGATALERRQYLLAERQPTQEQLNTRLLNAIRSTSAQRVQELLGLRTDNIPLTQEERPGLLADPNCLLPSSTPALAFAAQRFVAGAVEALLAAGADPHMTRTDGICALDYAVNVVPSGRWDTPVVVRTLALLEGPTLGCTRAEHAAKLTVGATVTWTDKNKKFPPEREGTVVEIREDGQRLVEGAAGRRGWMLPEKLRLREAA